MKTIIDLFLSFCRIGALTFGGGYAMLPMLQREVVERHKWATNEEVMDYFAIGQCMPGIIAANTAGFIGQKVRGTVGGIAAVLGVVFPSLVIITVIAAFLTNFSELAVVRNAFAGVRVCVSVLIINAVVKLWKSSVIDPPAFVIFVLVFAGAVFTDLSPILYVVLAAAAGILIQTFRTRRGQSGQSGDGGQ